LYLAGMSEQAFPAGSAAGWLAEEKDYQFFTRAAQQSERSEVGGRGSEPTEVTHSQEEMLLFYEVLSRAESTLTISYPAMDDKAQELPPSPYVVELQRMFAKSERQIHVTPPQLSPVSRPAEPRRADGTDVTESSECRSARGTYSATDWRLQAVAEAISSDGDLRLLAGLFSDSGTNPLADSIDAGIRIVHARARRDEFGTTEGLLRSPAVLASLTTRFGPKHAWSPSQLETYASCPFQFYVKHVLGLEPLGELALETDFTRRGSLFHEVLAAFHRKYRDLPDGEWAAIWADEALFAAELRNVLAETIGAAREGIDGALVELDRRQIDKWTGRYRDQHAKYDKPWESFDEPPRPTHFELRFGKKHRGESGEEDKDSTNLSFALEIGGEEIQISGRIDRIDVGSAGRQKFFNVIDYKSGQRPPHNLDKIESGERLQPALYAMAAEALLFGKGGAVPLWAGYWSMQQGVTTQEKYSLHCSDQSGKLTETWETLKPKVIARIAEIVHAARRGDFPVASNDPHCTRSCDFRTVCRVAQVRSLNKVWITGDA
jgi:RecB family exonuclease